jgi:hypothetical protein
MRGFAPVVLATMQIFNKLANGKSHFLGVHVPKYPG